MFQRFTKHTKPRQHGEKDNIGGEKKDPQQSNRQTPEISFSPVPNDIDQWTPLRYLKQFWDDDITDMLVKQTNLYRVEKSGTSIYTVEMKSRMKTSWHLNAHVDCKNAQI